MGAAEKLDGGEIDGGIPALIPPGVYALKFESWSTVMLFGRSPKVVLHFTVCDFGEHFGTRLNRWNNATRLIGQQGRHGRFKAGWSSDLFREFVTIAGVPDRTDRIPLSRYEKCLIAGEVVTVTTDRDQKPIPETLHYSVVRRLLRKEA